MQSMSSRCIHCGSDCIRVTSASFFEGEEWYLSSVLCCVGHLAMMQPRSPLAHRGRHDCHCEDLRDELDEFIFAGLASDGIKVDGREGSNGQAQSLPECESGKRQYVSVSPVNSSSRNGGRPTGSTAVSLHIAL